MIIDFPYPKFLGYVIANEREEYLHFFKQTSSYTKRVWVPLPVFAKRYGDRTRALRDCKRLSTTRRTWVLELFETATQFFVSFDEEDDPPPWI